MSSFFWHNAVVCFMLFYIYPVVYLLISISKIMLRTKYTCTNYHQQIAVFCSLCHDFVSHTTYLRFVNDKTVLNTSQDFKSRVIYQYWGLIRIHGGSIFAVFVGCSLPQIYIINKKSIRNNLSFFILKLKPTHPQNSTIKQIISQ